jgi:hypothetical protein
MEQEGFERTYPDALGAVRAPLFDDADAGFLQFDGVLWTDTDAAATEVTGVLLYFYEKHEEVFLTDGRGNIQLAGVNEKSGPAARFFRYEIPTSPH